jgi:beta-glucosidase
MLSKSAIGTSDNFNVTVTVHNTGSVDGKEVVQVNFEVADSVRISHLGTLTGLRDGCRKLCCHSKPIPCRVPESGCPVSVPNGSYGYKLMHFVIRRAGQSKQVSIEVLSEQLAVWTLQNTWAVEPGQFQVKIGSSAQVFAQTTLTVQ